MIFLNKRMSENKKKKTKETQEKVLIGSQGNVKEAIEVD